MAEVESPAHPRDALRDEQSRILLAAADRMIESHGEISVYRTRAPFLTKSRLDLANSTG